MFAKVSQLAFGTDKTAAPALVHYYSKSELATRFSLGIIAYSDHSPLPNGQLPRSL